MAHTSRRTFLRGAGVAAAAVTAGAAAPAASAFASDLADESPDASTDRLVVYVKDARTGQLSVMSGDRETVVTDRKLAQRLARLAD